MLENKIHNSGEKTPPKIESNGNPP